VKLNDLTNEVFLELIGSCGWERTSLSWTDENHGLVTRFATTDKVPVEDQRVFALQDPEGLQSPKREAGRGVIATACCARCPLCDAGALEIGEEPAPEDKWRAQSIELRIPTPPSERPLLDLDVIAAGGEWEPAEIWSWGASWVVHAETCPVPNVLEAGR
jgi:hypothetical protein